MGIFPKRQRGQGLTEYIIIIAVIAILTLGIVVRFGDSIRQLFTGSTKALTGEETGGLQSFATENPEKTLEDF